MAYLLFVLFVNSIVCGAGLFLGAILVYGIYEWVAEKYGIWKFQRVVKRKEERMNYDG